MPGPYYTKILIWLNRVGLGYQKFFKLPRLFQCAVRNQRWTTQIDEKEEIIHCKKKRVEAREDSDPVQVYWVDDQTFPIHL